jgi:biotin operon repressor
VNPPPWPDLLRTRLFYGRDRAVTIGTLTEQLGVSRRIVERAVEELRLSGAPICSGTQGLWLSTDARELYAHAARLRSRAIHVLLGARALRATARRHERVQQTTLFGDAA